MKSVTGRSPSPGMFRKCRLQYSRSMSMRGASASCTMKMRSPGIARIDSTSIRLARVWKESRMSPMLGCSARRTISQARSEEHTSELQSLMRISYAVFCLKKKKQQKQDHHNKKIQNTTQDT